VRFKRGVELYDEGDFRAALVEFRKAYELSPTYKVHFNIGQVCFQMQDYACALKSLSAYLKEGGVGVTGDRRAQVEHDLERLQARVARIDVSTNVPDVDVSVDDVYIGRTPLPAPVVVSAGRRRVTATKEGYAPVTRLVDVAGNETLNVDLALNGLERQPPKGPPPAASPSRFTTLSWAGIGAASLLAAGAAATGILALNASHQLRDERFVGGNPSAEAGDTSSRVRSLSITSDVLAGAAAVTLVTTLVLTLAHNPETPRRDSDVGVRVDVSPTGALLSGRFR
jgi:hypothetical protein